MAISRDGLLRTKIDTRLAALAKPGLAADDLGLEYSGLNGDLRSAVSAFPAVPSQEPGRSHAAFCVFVHFMAAQTMKMSPGWPRAVAEKLAADAEALV